MSCYNLDEADVAEQVGRAGALACMRAWGRAPELSGALLDRPCRRALALCRTPPSLLRAAPALRAVRRRGAPPAEQAPAGARVRPPAQAEPRVQHPGRARRGRRDGARRLLCDHARPRAGGHGCDIWLPARACACAPAGRHACLHQLPAHAGTQGRSSAALPLWLLRHRRDHACSQSKTPQACGSSGARSRATRWALSPLLPRRARSRLRRPRVRSRAPLCWRSAARSCRQTTWCPAWRSCGEAQSMAPPRSSPNRLRGAALHVRSQHSLPGAP